MGGMSMSRDMIDPEELGRFMAKLRETENLTPCQAADRAYELWAETGIDLRPGASSGLMSSPAKIAVAGGEQSPDVAPQERRNGRRAP